MPAEAAFPDYDTARIAGLYAAHTGNRWADSAERTAAQMIASRFPAAPERMHRVREYHAATALEAVTRGVRGVVHGACGYPADPASPADPSHPNPHAAAAAACPDARFCYADCCEPVAKICEAYLAGPRVAVCTASVRDPGGLLDCPAVAALPRPLHVQCQMAAHFWAPGFARALMAGYARLLSPGDELLLTWTVPSATAGGRRLTALASRLAGTRVYRHTAADVAGWLDDAGLRVAGAGPEDVRGPAPAWAERARALAPGRAMGVVARVR